MSKVKNHSISIEMFPAGHGDSFLITACINSDSRFFILVDCGLKETYNKVLRSRLLQLSKKGESLSRLIITHIDTDHINGALSLLNENDDSNNSKIINIEQIWHNSYRHIQFDKSDNPLSDHSYEVLKGIISSGYLASETDRNKEKEIGAKAGITLGGLILKNDYAWNKDSHGRAICTSNFLENEIHEDIQIQILSPSKEKLHLLGSKFVDAIEDMGIGSVNKNTLFDDAFEYLTSKFTPIQSSKNDISTSFLDLPEILENDFFKEDHGIPNGSSIAFILNVGVKKILMLGDAHSSEIENSLKETFPNLEETPIFFDAIKVSHHGSRNNTSPNLLKLIDSDVFLFSTNGKRHGHPDIETVSRIVSRHTNKTRRLYFNYATTTSELFNREEIKNQYNYNIFYNTKEVKI